MANGHGAKWDNAPLWDSIENKKIETMSEDDRQAYLFGVFQSEECKHNRITFGKVKTCKDCGRNL